MVNNKIKTIFVGKTKGIQLCLLQFQRGEENSHEDFKVLLMKEEHNSKILNFFKYFLYPNFLLIFFKIIFYAYTFPKFPNILIFYMHFYII